MGGPVSFHLTPSTIGTNVAIFTRISTKAHDYQRQISDLTAYAGKQGYHVVEIISEKISVTK